MAHGGHVRLIGRVGVDNVQRFGPCRRRSFNWFLAIVRALIKLQDEGTLDYHGDLKPENVIVKPSGKVVMLDPAMRLPDRRIGTKIRAVGRGKPLLAVENVAA